MTQCDRDSPPPYASAWRTVLRLPQCQTHSQPSTTAVTWLNASFRAGHAADWCPPVESPRRTAVTARCLAIGSAAEWGYLSGYEPRIAVVRIIFSSRDATAARRATEGGGTIAVIIGR